MGFKIKKVMIDNFGDFKHFAIEFASDVMHLIGFNGSGKTTTGFTAIWACFKGIAEKSTNGSIVGERFRFIGKQKASSDLEVHIFNDDTKETIICKNHMTKDTNKITFTSDKNRPITSDWINSIFNFVFMSAKSFCQLSGKEQALKLGIDVSRFDAEIKALKTQYTGINAVIRSIGTLVEPEPVEPVNVDTLTEQKNQIRKKLNDQYLANVEHNKKLRADYNSAVATEKYENDRFNNFQNGQRERISEATLLLAKLKTYGYEGLEVSKWISSLEEPLPLKTVIITTEPEYIAERPDDSELVAIDEKIAQASSINQKAALYAKYLKDKAELDAKKKELADNEAVQTAKEKEKLDYIQSFKFGFSGLSVDDEGGLLLNNRPIKDPYFSKGELELIVARIAAKMNPEWKTRFIDDFDILDDENQVKIVKELTDNGFRVITSIVRPYDHLKNDGSVTLKECAIDEGKDDYEEAQTSLF